jgi:phytoene synthase
MSGVEKAIFRKGSTTYYWSSTFFTRRVRRDVAKLYSFVRVADDYVDSTPVQEQDFYALRRAYEAAAANPSFNTEHQANDSINEHVIKNMIVVEKAYDFNPAWSTAFLDSMQSDIEGKVYETMDDTLRYIYGSAEVVGLMMARVLGLDETAYASARKLGRAMQYINFIRDVAEDTQLGRCYFPKSMLERFGLPDLSSETINRYPKRYETFIRTQIKQYQRWQHEAEQGFVYLPSAVRAPVKTASDMYKWSAAKIARDPIAAYRQQVKPHKARVVRAGIINFLAR